MSGKQRRENLAHLPPAFLSRSGSTNPLGKLTYRIPAFVVPEETGELIDERVRATGMAVSELIREAVMIHFHGEEHVQRLYAERIRVVAGRRSE